MTITADRQVEFNGLRLDGAYEIQSIDGLAGSPEVRTSDLQLASRHGLYPGADLLGGRAVTITVAVYAWSQADFAEAVAALRAAFQPGAAAESPLTFQLPGIAGGVTARINARARRAALPVTTQYHQLSATAVVELFATDPRIYADRESTVAVTLPLTSGGTGLSWPLSWPLSWGGPASSGLVTATNDGTFPAELTLRVNGPVTNPRIENLTTGTTLSLGITVADGDYLLIDTASRDVLLNGTASRYSTVAAGSSWPTLAPGANSLRFAADTETDAVLYASWSSAWI